MGRSTPRRDPLRPPDALAQGGEERVGDDKALHSPDPAVEEAAGEVGEELEGDLGGAEPERPALLWADRLLGPARESEREDQDRFTLPFDRDDHTPGPVQAFVDGARYDAHLFLSQPSHQRVDAHTLEAGSAAAGEELLPAAASRPGSPPFTASCSG